MFLSSLCRFFYRVSIKKISVFVMDECARARIMSAKKRRISELATKKMGGRYYPVEKRDDVYCRHCGKNFAHMDKVVSRRSSRCSIKHYHEECARIVKIL